MIRDEHRKYGMQFVQIEQTIPEEWKELTEKLKEKQLKEAPFKYYLEKHLKRGDNLPRGKFFKGKTPGKPFMLFVDEFPFIPEKMRLSPTFKFDPDLANAEHRERLGLDVVATSANGNFLLATRIVDPSIIVEDFDVVKEISKGISE